MLNTMKESHKGAMVEYKKGIEPASKVRMNEMINFLNKEISQILYPKILLVSFVNLDSLFIYFLPLGNNEFNCL